MMIGARLRVVNEDGSSTAEVFALSFWEVEQTAKARCSGGAVKIAFPIEPERFFASGLYSGVRAGLEATEGLTHPISLS
jgi:hypothetical protein